MATADPPVLPAVLTRTSDISRHVRAEPSRFADFVELTKPKIAAMALVTVAAGYALGADPAAFRPDLLVHTLIGAGLVAAGGSALNHWLERRADANMWRTANRPLPGGRVLPGEALGYGIVLAVGGTMWLTAALPSPAAAVAAALTFALYVFVYTPLKQVTHWNTVVGAVPGALPPVIGWAAARGGVSAEGWALFAILFVWQLPHFYSIAYLHRDDYARGGMVMLPVIDGRNARRTGWATALTCGLLLVVTAAPFAVGSVGWVYLIGAMPLGAWFLARSVRFALDRNNRTARAVLRGSLVYLLGVMALLVIDGVIPRYVG